MKLDEAIQKAREKLQNPAAKAAVQGEMDYLGVLTAAEMNQRANPGRRGDTYEIYVNGALEARVVDSHTMEGSEANMHLMHHGAWGHCCNGVLDDVRIYNRALSASEIQQLYLAPQGH